MTDQNVGPGVHTIRHAIDLLKYWAEDGTDEPDIVEVIRQSTECAGELEQLEARVLDLQQFVDRCHELGATDTDIVKHALEDAERIRTELTPLSIEAMALRTKLSAVEAELEKQLECLKTCGYGVDVREKCQYAMAALLFVHRVLREGTRL